MTTMDEYQAAAEATAIYPPNVGLEYTALGLVGEAGEYANKVKKLLRDGYIDREGCIDELGDSLWYLANAAKEQGTTLDEVARRNMTKLADRQERGQLRGSGDER